MPRIGSRDGIGTGDKYAGNTWVESPMRVSEFLNKSGITLTSGNVVTIGTSNNDAVTVSSTSGDTGVIGVVVERSTADSKVKVCTHGKMRARVVAPITRGQVLGMSGAGGYVATTAHVDGAMIGSALEALASGSGEILIMVNKF